MIHFSKLRILTTQTKFSFLLKVLLLIEWFRKNIKLVFEWNIPEHPVSVIDAMLYILFSISGGVNQPSELLIPVVFLMWPEEKASSRSLHSQDFSPYFLLVHVIFFSYNLRIYARQGIFNY